MISAAVSREQRDERKKKVWAVIFLLYTLYVWTSSRVAWLA